MYNTYSDRCNLTASLKIGLEWSSEITGQNGVCKI